MNSSQIRQPTLFIGHGNPMNTIQNHAFTQALHRLGKQLPPPQTILCISAHWITQGTWVTHMDHPKTIHDFYGFPEELSQIQYPAPGSPKVAELIHRMIQNPTIHLDENSWGLDHGTWSVLRQMYPRANIPVIQLSIDLAQPPQYHFRIGQQLRILRDQGVLIVGSGNIVHNLRWVDLSPHAKPLDWAIEFDEWVKNRLIQGDFQSLVDQATSFNAGKLSHPTPDHWYPLLYVLGASNPRETLQFHYEAIEHASLSMRCLSYT